MVKLSEQMQRGTPQRQTRTQRVASRQRFTKETKYEEGRAKAQGLQKEFSGLGFQEYKRRYNLLDPSVQQFYSDPNVIERQRQDLRNKNGIR